MQFYLNYTTIKELTISKRYFMMKSFTFFAYFSLLSFAFSGCMNDTVASAPDTTNSTDTQEEIVVPGEAIAQLGNLANAKVSIYEVKSDGSLLLKWTEVTSSGTQLNQIGRFTTHLDEFKEETFYLFKVEGGEDWDVEDDGVLDDKYTQNLGTIHALAKTEDLQYAGTEFRVTPATEILYELSAKYLGHDINTTQLQEALDNYSRTIVEDLDDNGKIDTRDVLIYSVPSYKPMLQEPYLSELPLYLQNIHEGKAALPSLSIITDDNISVFEGDTDVTPLVAQNLLETPVTWSIVSGDDKNLFTIQDNSMLVFTQAPDFEKPSDADSNNIYQVAVSATNGTDTETKKFYVHIINLNDLAPTIQVPTQVTLPETTTKVMQLTGTDPDNDSLTWSITGGEDASLFQIDGDTLYFKASPDYENPSDSDKNNVYNVTLTLSDGTHTVSQAVQITVTNIENESFIMEVKTDNNGTSSDTQFTIPTRSSDYTYNYSVDCDNDGIFESNATDGNYTCNYATPGTYEIVIVDNSPEQKGFPTLYFNNSGDKNKLIGIKQWGIIHWASMDKAFYGCQNFNSLGEGTPNLTDVTSMYSMFKDATNFNQNIDNWDTSNITNMNSMFDGATNFNQPLGSWNTSNVTDMAHMFEDAINFNQNISTWDTSKVENMSNMFRHAIAFNQDINSWNTAKVTDMNCMFRDDPIFNQPLDKWNTSSVVDMYGMFYNATAFNQPIGTWDTSHVQNLDSMFKYAASFNQSLSNWKTSNVLRCTEMFYYATAFDNSLENWDVSHVTDMGSMFKYATHFNQALSKWDTASVTNMNSMFYGASAFNKDITNFHTQNVTDMANMFKNAYHFDQYIAHWNTSQVTDMHSMFYDAAAFNQNIGNWDTQNVIDMNSMFKHAIRFNQYIGNWNTSKVTDMHSMFYGATRFNQNLSLWDTHLVTNMESMFKDATLFNSELGNWDTSQVTNMNSMFQNLTEFNQDLNNWNTGKVQDMANMFYNNQNFNGNISSWDVSQVKTMHYMFKGDAKFNQNISLWDTSNVTDMEEMFYGNTAFNQDIGNWSTGHVTTMKGMFKYATAFNQSIKYWNTENVTDMSTMFYNAKAFNQDISPWDTSKVTTMNSMFYNAESFANHDLSGWNVSQVTDHTDFLKNAGSGNTEPIWP